MLDRGSYTKKFFDGRNLKIQYNKDVRIPGPPKSRSLEAELNVSDAQFIDLILGCLKWEPSERYTAEELMNHPFLADYRSGL